MEIILITIEVLYVLGFMAGLIVIIAKYIKLIKVKNVFLEFIFKVIFIFFSIIIFNLPTMILLYRERERLHEISGIYNDVFIIISILWYLSIVTIGIYTVLRDWHLKDISLKHKELENHNMLVD